MKTDCKRCQRTGLSILPVLYAVAPKEVLKGYAGPKGANNKFGANVYNHVLGESAYYLRRPGPGYIYLLYPNNVWKGYLIDAAGYPRYYPDLTTEDMPGEIPEQSDVVACQRQGGGSHVGVESICIENPDQLKALVWIAYSRTKWTKKVRDEYAKSPAVRMQFIVPRSDDGFNHAEKADAGLLSKCVADFNAPLLKKINETLPESEQIRDMSGREESLIDAMCTASGTRNNPGVVMALVDPIGVTARLNDFRNELVERGQIIEKNTSEAEKDDLKIAAMIENLRESVAKNGGDWARYEKHLDSARYTPVRQALQERHDLVKRAARASTDYLAWMTADSTKYLFAHDFEADHKTAGLDLEECFIKCVQGSGVTGEEREKLWLPWLTAEPEESILWKAASANDKEILTALATDKIDKLFDATKGSVGAFTQTSWFEHMHQAWAKVQQRRRQLPEFQAATHALALTLASQLQWLRATSKSNTQYFRAISRLAAVLVTRGDMLLIPQNVTAPAHRFVRWAQESFLAVPKVTVPLSARQTPKPKSPKAIKAKEIVDEEAKVFTGLLDGALMVDVGKRDAPLAFTAWVISKLEPGKDMDTDLAREFRKLDLDPEKFRLPDKFKFNPLSEEARGLKNARFLDRPLSAISGIFAFLSYMKAADELVIEQSKGANADDEKMMAARAGMLTAIASGIAAGMEFQAARMVIAKRGLTTLGVRVLGLTAGGIGFAVGVNDAYWTWSNGASLDAAQDTDAADLAFASSGIGLAGAGFGFAGAVMIFFSVTGIGLVIVLGVSVVLGLTSVALGIKSDEAVDTELEIWLNRGRFGAHSRPDCKDGYAGLADEVQGFMCAVYALRIVKKPGRMFVRVHSGKLCQPLELELVAPVYADNSRVRLTIAGKSRVGGEQALYQATYEHGATTANDVMVAPEMETHRVSVRKEGSSLMLNGDFVIEQSGKPGGVPRGPGHSWPRTETYDEIVVSVKYQPDIKTWPDFEAKGQT